MITEYAAQTNWGDLKTLVTVLEGQETREFRSIEQAIVWLASRGQAKEMVLLLEEKATEGQAARSVRMNLYSDRDGRVEISGPNNVEAAGLESQIKASAAQLASRGISWRRILKFLATRFWFIASGVFVSLAVALILLSLGLK